MGDDQMIEGVSGEGAEVISVNDEDLDKSN